jgi:hypothetical protein
MIRLCLILTVGFVISLGEPGELSAQLFGSAHKGPALTEPPADDPNYALMGEFIGEIRGDDDQQQRLGLQLRPVGNDQFDAISFLGGLPGEDQHERQPMRMIGRRSGDFLVLSGGPWAIFVEPGSCNIINREGEKIGRLERVQRVSPTLGARPPADALVLFDGTDTEHFARAEMTDGGLLKEGADIKPMFQDFNLHVEFRLPYMPEATDQGRANSGLYLQSRYECQVLDSFAQDPVYNGCGALYKFRAPDLNMCLPPLVWQTYDIQFTAPRWASDGTKLRDAHVTSWVNGVKVQDNVALPSKTGAGKDEAPTLLPIRIQDHGDPVRFRNVWIIDRGLASGEFPVYPTPEQIIEDDQREQARAAAKQVAAEPPASEEAAAELTEPPATEPPAETTADTGQTSAENPERK